jgi:hypothetical protein
VKDFFSWIWGWILDVFEGIAGFLRGFVEDFKESNRYFRIKVWMVGGYVAVSIATIFVFIPPGELNEIDAHVWMSKTEIVGGRYFMVTNQSSDVWEDMELRINDIYVTKWPRLRPGKKKGYFFNRFKDEGGRSPDEGLTVRKFRIDCSDGAFERDFTKNR